MGLVMRLASRRLRAIGVGLCLWAGLAGAPVQAAPSLAVKAVAVLPAGEGARVIIDLNKSAKTSSEMLPAPQPRFVIELPAADWRVKDEPKGPLVSGVRHGQHPGQTRLVLDLMSEARVAAFSQVRTGDGYRLVFELAPVSRGELLGAPAAAPAPAVAPTPPPARRAPIAPRARRVVVVDAGHGAHDSGAPGKLGMEKDYNLQAAFVLRESLENRGYSVVLTRNSDKFLPLADRVTLAREVKADLFISLHSDADPKGQAKGATIFTLSQQGNQRARKVMNAEDWSVDLGPAQPAAGVSNILLDLTQRETNTNSADFAYSVLGRLNGVVPLAGKTPRRAGFFVLLAPDVPAVLLEMGFVTHAEDEKRLASASQRKTMMDAVAASVDDYFQSRKTYASVSP